MLKVKSTFEKLGHFIVAVRPKAEPRSGVALRATICAVSGLGDDVRTADAKSAGLLLDGVARIQLLCQLG